jgi:ankyrin repeat protein
VDDTLDLDDGRECVEVLLAAGAHPNVRNNDGKTPLGVARFDLAIEMLKKLGLEE